MVLSKREEEEPMMEELEVLRWMGRVKNEHVKKPVGNFGDKESIN